MAPPFRRVPVETKGWGAHPVLSPINSFRTASSDLPTGHRFRRNHPVGCFVTVGCLNRSGLPEAIHVLPSITNDPFTSAGLLFRSIHTGSMGFVWINPYVKFNPFENSISSSDSIRSSDHTISKCLLGTRRVLLGSRGLDVSIVRADTGFERRSTDRTV